VATLRTHISEKEIFLVALDATPVATFELQTKKTFWYDERWFAEPDAAAFYLLHMAVSPERQRRGNGRIIVAKIEDIARGAGRRAVRFDAYDAAAGAGAFYQKCGYALVHSGSFNDVPGSFRPGSRQSLRVMAGP
jgi:GNAT superfamily N-acetyltransferase